jgi:hypothetical protein
MSKHVKVLHLDDQSEQASWIPREINSWFWKHFRAEMATTSYMEENDEETQFLFQLRLRDDEITVEYLILSDADEFLASVKEANESIILLVLDQAIRNDFQSGGRVFLEIEQYSKVLADKVIILTAYPGVTCSQLLACTRFRRHRVRCFDGTGGVSWRDGSLHASSSSRLCG